MYNKIKNLKSTRGTAELTEAKVKTQKSKKLLVPLFFGICFFFIGISAQAQCAMCRAAIESEGNNQTAAAINDGIVYLMAIPYVLVGVLGFYVYKMYAKKKNT